MLFFRLPVCLEGDGEVDDAPRYFGWGAHVTLTDSSSRVPNGEVEAKYEVNPVSFALRVHHVLKVKEGALFKTV